MKSKILLDEYGDGGSLHVIMYKKEGKRYYVRVYAQGKSVELKSFNTKINALKHFKKVVEEF